MEWSEDRVQQLKDMWAKGMSARQIAETLGGGVTRNAVIGKAHRIGLSQPSPAKAKPKENSFQIPRDRDAKCSHKWAGASLVQNRSRNSSAAKRQARAIEYPRN